MNSNYVYVSMVMPVSTFRLMERLPVLEDIKTVIIIVFPVFPSSYRQELALGNGVYQYPYN
jgi:hypothetical protein